MPLRYAGWMTRDLLAGPGLVMLAVAGLVVLVTSRGGVIGAVAAPIVVRQTLNQSLLALTLVLTGHIVSGDLTHGYYRSYFSRPVSPALYYLQRWLLGGAALLAYVPLIALAVAVHGGQVALDPVFFQKAALFYLLVGGTAFLLSTVTRRDWIAAAILYALEVLLHTAQTAGVAFGPVARALYTMLPPYHAASIGQPMPAGSALWGAIGYGSALVIAALAILRRRPLG